MKFLTYRHQKLMEASEYALEHAAQSPEIDKGRIASTVISDNRIYRTWENAHAELLIPAARQRSDQKLLAELRRSQVTLVQHRALFRYLDNNQIRGEKRKQILRLFHSTLDFQDAVLREHRRFMFAVSSRISTRHISHFMADTSGDVLIRRYEQAYDQYFGLKCEVALTKSPNAVALIRPFLATAQLHLRVAHQRLQQSKPSVSGFKFEVQESLNRSGRYKALNYLNA